MSFTDDGHDFNVLAGIKTAIFRGETETLNEYLQRYRYSAHEIRQFADIAEMLDQPQIAKDLQQRADTQDVS